MERMQRGCAKESDVLLLVLPLFHIYAMNCAMNAYLRAGATIVLIRRFDAPQVLELIQKHRCTMFHGAQPMYITWVNTPALGNYDLSSMRFACSGAAPLPVQLLDRFRVVTGVEITEGYGLTETSPVRTSIVPPRSASRARSDRQSGATQGAARRALRASAGTRFG
jgi:acyl-CoA synthetase (AMP-forming)/AMP-acid ligase II